MKEVFKTVVLASLVGIVSCAAPSIPPRGEPIRVAQIQKNKIKLEDHPLEQYVAGVLQKEVQGNWPLEALKAQAVATRTYALFQKSAAKDGSFHVRSDTGDQVFNKTKHPSPNITIAVLETEGQVLEYQGKIFKTFFHSCCGGMSESANRIWPGQNLPPLQSIHTDPYCTTCPPSHWDLQIPRKELEQSLASKGVHLPKDWTLEITARTDTGRVSEVSFRDPSGSIKNQISGTKFRDLLGNGRLKSTLFEMASSQGEDPIIFHGRGFGHGIGLCQWGAKGMADEGHDYRDILEFYYPGTTIDSRVTKANQTLEIDPTIFLDNEGQE